MQFLRTHSLFLLGIMAAMLPPAPAQTSTAPAANPNASANEKLKLADEAFRAGSAAYLRNDLHSAHIQFAKLVQLAPAVAAGHTAFGTVLLAEGDARSAVKQLELARGLDPRDAGATLNLALAYSQLRRLCEIGADVSAARSTERQLTAGTHASSCNRLRRRVDCNRRAQLRRRSS